MSAPRFEAQEALAHLLSDEVMLERINAAGNLMADALQSGGRIYSCGNGGSLCDAMHFAEEMTDATVIIGRPMLRQRLPMPRTWPAWPMILAMNMFSPATLKASRVREMSCLAFPLRARAKTCSVRLRRPEPRGEGSIAYGASGFPDCQAF